MRQKIVIGMGGSLLVRCSGAPGTADADGQKPEDAYSFLSTNFVYQSAYSDGRLKSSMRACGFDKFQRPC